MKRMTGTTRWITGAVGAGAMVAALGAGTLSSAWAADDTAPASRTAAAQPAGTSEAIKPVAGKTVSGSKVHRSTKASTVQVSSWEVEQMVALAREVAGPSGARLTQVQRDDTERAVSLLALTAGGDFEVSAWISPDPDELRSGKRDCKTDQQHPQDGRICKALRSTSTLGIWARDYPAQPGRQTLQLAALTRDGGTLWVQFSNHTETPQGTKQIGPRWQDAGFTVTRLIRAAQHSDLILIETDQPPA